MKTVAVIPARYGSTRFPGKPLVAIAGRPMIQWVYERTAAAAVDQTLVATDDERVMACVERFGGRAVMTSPDHPSGTDRIAEAIRDTDAELIVNVQGDEPLVPTAVIDELITAMQTESAPEMGTVAVRIRQTDEEFTNPNLVKAVIDAQSCALYFSRAPIPFARDGIGAEETALAHWGMYAYTRETLTRFISWPPSMLERTEKLEQLRALEHGVRIRVIVTDVRTVGVDTPADLARVEALLQAQGATRAG